MSDRDKTFNKLVENLKALEAELAAMKKEFKEKYGK